MSFFDDLGKKISSASQEAIAKTKDFADIAKLNSNISDEERKMNAAYIEIGKTYFENHASDFENCYEAQFTTIKEAKEKIEDLERQIIEIKGVIKCPKCGAEVPKTATVCPICNAEIVNEIKVPCEVVEDIQKKCPECGEVVNEDATFCMKCGAKL